MQPGDRRDGCGAPTAVCGRKQRFGFEAEFGGKMEDFRVRLRERGVLQAKAMPGFSNDVGKSVLERGRRGFQRSSAIWTALRAAPLRSWSPQTQRARPFSKAQSSRRRPAKQSSLPAASMGIG